MLFHHKSIQTGCLLPDDDKFVMNDFKEAILSIEIKLWD